MNKTKDKDVQAIDLDKEPARAPKPTKIYKCPKCGFVFEAEAPKK